jgi:hypothetical protein
MNLTSLFPPTIIARLLDDLGAVADAARRLPELERAVLKRVDSMQTELAMVRNEIAAVRVGVERLGDEIAPIREISAVREGVDRLSAELAPIAQLGPVKERLDEIAELVKPIAEIREVRKGIEPLDEDMRAVRDSVDDLEPLMRDVVSRLDALRADLGPLGELADKIPGIG